LNQKYVSSWDLRCEGTREGTKEVTHSQCPLFIREALRTHHGGHGITPKVTLLQGERVLVKKKVKHFNAHKVRLVGGDALCMCISVFSALFSAHTHARVHSPGFIQGDLAFGMCMKRSIRLWVFICRR
jgi:hypothetical protein